MSTYQPTGPAGYTCPLCRSFVPNGTVHSCAAGPWPQPGPQAPQVRPVVDVRIAAALERIAIALEAISRTAPFLEELS